MMGLRCSVLRRHAIILTMACQGIQINWRLDHETLCVRLRLLIETQFTLLTLRQIGMVDNKLAILTTLTQSRSYLLFACSKQDKDIPTGSPSHEG